MAKNTLWPRENWPPKPPMMFQALASPANRNAVDRMFRVNGSPERLPQRRQGGQHEGRARQFAERPHLGIAGARPRALHARRYRPQLP
jgi:hypothetical protein